MAQYPSINDREFNLWVKIASNLYDRAIHIGLSGFNPPSYNDRTFDLQKKAAYYSARIAEDAS